MLRHFALTLSLSVVAAAQSHLDLGTTPNVESAPHVSARLEVSANTTITLTQLTFWTGASTTAGTSIGLEVYLVGAPSSFPSDDSFLHLGNTVPQAAAGGAQQVTQTIVPAAGSGSVTLAPGQYQLALVAGNHTLGLTGGTFVLLQDADSFVSATAHWAITSFQTAAQAFTGSLHYALGGTPTNLQQIRSYGTGCGGLQLTATGSPTVGGSVTYTTGGTIQPGIGIVLFATQDLGGPNYPNGLPMYMFGAPGCFAHIDPGSSTFSTVVSNLAGQPGMSVTLPLPPNPLFLGFPIFAQSVWIDPAANPLGWLLSNGVQIRIG